MINKTNLLFYNRLINLLNKINKILNKNMQIFSIPNLEVYYPILNQISRKFNPRHLLPFLSNSYLSLYKIQTKQIELPSNNFTKHFSTFSLL